MLASTAGRDDDGYETWNPSIPFELMEDLDTTERNEEGNNGDDHNANVPADAAWSN